MDRELKRSIILDNYENSPYRKVPSEEGYHVENSRNHSCIDNINVYLKEEDGIIKDVTFEGEACVICISSSSIMCKLLKGKSVEDAKNIIDNYNKMVNEEDFDKDVLEEAIVYEDIGKQPSRKGCATLFVRAVDRIIK